MNRRGGTRAALRLAPAAVLGVALCSTSCWLALGFQNDKSATTTGTGGAAGTGGATGSSDVTSSSTTSSGTAGACTAGPIASFGDAGVLLGNVASLAAIAVSSSEVFWLTAPSCGQAAIHRAQRVPPIPDGGIGTADYNMAVTMAGFFYANKFLYGGVYGCNNPALPAIMQCTADGYHDGTPNLIFDAGAPADAGAATYYATALLDPTIVWSTDIEGGSVWRGATDGTAATRMASGEGVPLPLVALDHQTVYWVAPTNSIRRASTKDSPTTFVATACPNQPHAGSLFADPTGGFLYWTCDQDGTIYRIPTSAPANTPPELVASNEVKANSLAVDDTNLYWLTETAVRTLPLCAAPHTLPTTLATGNEPVGIAVDPDGHGIWVAMSGDGTILTIPKP